MTEGRRLVLGFSLALLVVAALLVTIYLATDGQAFRIRSTFTTFAPAKVFLLVKNFALGIFRM